MYNMHKYQDASQVGRRLDRRYLFAQRMVHSQQISPYTTPATVP